MTVPPYLLSCVGIVSGAWLAARTGRRAPLIIGSAVVAILGMAHCSCLTFFLVPTAFQDTLSSSQLRHVRYLYNERPRRLK
jgi:MFS family permease